MTYNEDSKKNVSLKILPREELESRVDMLLAKCRAEVDIKRTADRGAMFRKGPFQISISHAFKIKQYQDDLLYCRRKPYDILFNVCSDNNWGTPELRAVDYIPGEGFLFSIVVKDCEVVSQWRNSRLELAADFASANFLNYLGLWVNVKNLSLFPDWEDVTDVDSQSGGIRRHEDVGNFNGYLNFMDLNTIKSEETCEKQSTLINRGIIRRASKPFQSAKLLYAFLASRGEKIPFLTDIVITYLEELAGGLEPEKMYDFNNEKRKSQSICKKLSHKLSFCDKYYFYLMLKDYYYIHRSDPFIKKISEKLKLVNKEENSAEISEKLKLVNKEENSAEKYLKDTINDMTLYYETTFRKLKDVKKEKEDSVEHCTKRGEAKVFDYRSNFKSEVKHPEMNLNLPMTSVKLEPTEFLDNPGSMESDLKLKVGGLVKEEKVDGKLSVNNKRKLVKIESSEGSLVPLMDICLLKNPQTSLFKRARSCQCQKCRQF